MSKDKALIDLMVDIDKRRRHRVSEKLLLDHILEELKKIVKDEKPEPKKKIKDRETKIQKPEEET